MAAVTNRIVEWIERFVIGYAPNPHERPFLARTATQARDDVRVTVAVPSDREAEHIFGVHLAHRGLQAVWLEITNEAREALWLDRVCLDPDYFTAAEAARLARYAMGKRLLAFGLLGWMYLPLLPILPLKLWGARIANRRMTEVFRELSFPGGAIAARQRVSGYVFTPLDEGVKHVNVRLLNAARSLEFEFTIAVPGLRLPAAESAAVGAEVDEAGLRRWLERQPRCTSNAAGTVEGDPLNLVIVGERTRLEEGFRSWDETETLTPATAWKTVRAFVLESRYRYSPVSPLYLDGRQQDLALQRARLSLNERLHLRLWATGLRFGGQPIWIGQVSRDIGVRLTLKTWNLTTHLIDPEVDEARDYVLNSLLAARRVARLGLIAGVDAASREAPRRNLTGDPYFTDGRRAVLVLSAIETKAELLGWSMSTADEPGAARAVPNGGG
ncbi:MAG TPA: LssY C-terminal domain-containing protein [Candidatus Binataceae bacterium]|nr:LssY C-terminal domain-containing protein [Candidatus Binataceae bacterium]